MMKIRELMRHRNPIIKWEWTQAVSKEDGRRMKGIGTKRTGKSRGVEGHDTIRPIRKSLFSIVKILLRSQKKEEQKVHEMHIVVSVSFCHYCIVTL